MVITKHPAESYGLSLGTILFVKDLDPRGPASREGRLEPGDVILKVEQLIKIAHVATDVKSCDCESDKISRLVNRQSLNTQIVKTV